MTGRSIFAAAVLPLVVAFAGPQAVAQEPAGKSGIERMYVLYCGDIALDNASEFTPGATGPGALTVTCYLIKHRDGWLLFDTGLGDQIAAMPNGFKSQVGLWTVKRTLTSELAELGMKPSDITYLVRSPTLNGTALPAWAEAVVAWVPFASLVVLLVGVYVPSGVRVLRRRRPPQGRDHELTDGEASPTPP